MQSDTFSVSVGSGTVSLTAEMVQGAPWRYNSRQWRAAHKIHVPWIAEISPMQMGLMSKRRRAQYRAERSEQWAASAKGCTDFVAAVIAAYDAGLFQLEGSEVSDETRSAVYHEQIRREGLALKTRLEELDRQNRDMAGLKVGAVVYDLMSRSYVTVVKISVKSARISCKYTKSGSIKSCLTALNWLGYSDLNRLALAGKSTIERKSTAAVN